MTKTEADVAYKLHLLGGKRNPSIARQVCEAWNKGDLKPNFLGGIGYHVRNGRIVHNSKEHTQSMVNA